MFSIFRKIDYSEYGEIVKLKDIRIKRNFLSNPIRPEKIQKKIDYYKKHWCFKDDIILNKKNELIDGYSTYKLARLFGLHKVMIKRAE